jgi:itaconyl-CoA hydratase
METEKNPEGGRYFEDFEVGRVFKHLRGKTVKESDAVTICNMVMNTAQGHFNDHFMSDLPAGKSVIYGGVNIAMVIGMSAQDTAENCIKELGMTNLKNKRPMRHGDTMYAYTEVLGKEDSPELGGGILHLKHYGVNQDDQVFFEGERTLLIKKRT